MGHVPRLSTMFVHGSDVILVDFQNRSDFRIRQRDGILRERLRTLFTHFKANTKTIGIYSVRMLLCAFGKAKFSLL